MSKHDASATYAPLLPAVERPHASDDLEAEGFSYDLARRALRAVELACQAAYELDLEADLLVSLPRGERPAAVRQVRAGHLAASERLAGAVALLDQVDAVGAADSEPLWARVREAVGEVELAADRLDLVARAV